MSDDLDKYEFDTLAVRAGTVRSQFNEHSEALFLSSSFKFKSAAQAAARFANEEPGPIYSRFSNPTISMFTDRLAALEGAEACIATSSGMSAILSCVMGLMKAGEHIVASSGVFGATVTLFGTIMAKFGIETTWVSSVDPRDWEKAVKPNTKMLYLETPSNPMMEIFDIVALKAVAQKGGAWLVVDNCLCTPALQKPLELGADIVVHSATKYIDGQGRVLGGTVLVSKELVIEQIGAFLRTAGPSLSPFNAWIMLKGLDTLRLRMDAQSANALAIAQWLEQHPRVERVYYPFLQSHPQYALAKKQQSAGAAVVSFEVKGEREAAWRVIDQTKLISITANLGDTRTTITHPATTTHGRISPEARAAAGIKDGLLRVAVGLDAVEDLKRDLQGGLQS
ncbi:MAG TPA: O-succinylhomoserine sulfhydrylase [Burkholderiales bacterium]|nr:O-succinylhomoserine sulfhydrylase [Burkholderiales bacterium]